MITSAALIIFALLFHLSGYIALVYRLEPFQYYFYLTAWWSYIIFLDALLSLRGKGHLILNPHLPFLICLSCAFWCIFELLNVHIQNWFYINLPGDGVRRFGGYLLAFGTVIPGIYGTTELIGSLVGDISIRPRKFPKYPLWATAAGFSSLLLVYLLPLYFFALVWVFPLLILDGYCYIKGYRSLMGDLESGKAGNLLSAMAAGLLCGILWESWNYWNIAKWVYTVPFFEDTKIFEMPVLGYLGFILFGLETEVFMRFLSGVGALREFRFHAVIPALVIAFATFPLIDGVTVFSYSPEIEKLQFIAPEKRSNLETKSIQTSYGINPSILSENEVEALKLLHLKGLGIVHFERLAAQDINSIRKLALLDEKRLAGILEEPNPRRVRVYLKAAQQFMLTQ